MSRFRVSEAFEASEASRLTFSARGPRFCDGGFVRADRIRLRFFVFFFYELSALDEKFLYKYQWD